MITITPTTPISFDTKPPHPPFLKKKRILIVKNQQKQENDITAINISPPRMKQKTTTPEVPQISDAHNVSPPRVKEKTTTPEVPQISDARNTSPPRVKEKTTTENDYIQSLSKKEYKAYLIAKSHLMTSFSLNKSNGYLSYVSSLETHKITP